MALKLNEAAGGVSSTGVKQGVRRWGDAALIERTYCALTRESDVMDGGVESGQGSLTAARRHAGD